MAMIDTWVMPHGNNGTGSTSSLSSSHSLHSHYSHLSHQSRLAAPPAKRERSSVFGVAGSGLSNYATASTGLGSLAATRLDTAREELIEDGDAFANAEMEAHDAQIDESVNELPTTSWLTTGNISKSKLSAASGKLSESIRVIGSSLRQTMVEDDLKESDPPDAVNLNPTEETMIYRNAHYRHRRRCVLMPGSFFLTAWRLIMAFSVVWAVLLSTLMLGFSWWEPPQAVNIINGIVEILFYIDMLISFFTAKMEHGRLICKHYHIAKGYLKSWFVIDIITNFPWDKLVLINDGGGDQGSKSRKLVKAMKMPKIARVIRLLRVATDEAVYFGTLFSVVKLAFISHCFCCLWAGLLIDCEGESCPNVGKAYAEGLTVGFATIAGADAWLRFRDDGAVASKDGSSAYSWGNPPHFLAEIAATVACLIGIVALAVLFANVANTLHSIGSHTLVFNDRLSNLKAASAQHDIPHELYSRLKNHFHYVWSCGSDASVSLLQDRALTVDLRRQLGMSFYGRQLKSVPFLARCEEGLLKQLCMRVEMECFSPSDHLIEAGETGSELYFLVAGRASIQLPSCGKILTVLEEGCYFGEMAFLFPGTCRTVHVIAETFGWLLFVDRSALEEICSEDLLVQFREIAMEIYQLSCGPRDNDMVPVKSGRICSCGNELLVDARFCRKCGKKVQEASQSEDVDAGKGIEITQTICEESEEIVSSGSETTTGDHESDLEKRSNHSRSNYQKAGGTLECRASPNQSGGQRALESEGQGTVRGRSMSTMSAFEHTGWKSIRHYKADTNSRARRLSSLSGDSGAAIPPSVLERNIQHRQNGNGPSDMVARVDRIGARVACISDRIESRLDKFIAGQRHNTAEQRHLVLRLQEQMSQMNTLQYGYLNALPSTENWIGERAD